MWIFFGTYIPFDAANTEHLSILDKSILDATTTMTTRATKAEPHGANANDTSQANTWPETEVQWKWKHETRVNMRWNFLLAARAPTQPTRASRVSDFSSNAVSVVRLDSIARSICSSFIWCASTNQIETSWKLHSSWQAYAPHVPNTENRISECEDGIFIHIHTVSRVEKSREGYSDKKCGSHSEWNRTRLSPCNAIHSNMNAEGADDAQQTNFRIILKLWKRNFRFGRHIPCHHRPIVSA